MLAVNRWLIVNDGTTARLQAAVEAVLLSQGALLPPELTIVPSTWPARFRRWAMDLDLGFADLDVATASGEE